MTVMLQLIFHIKHVQYDNNLFMYNMIINCTNLNIVILRDDNKLVHYDHNNKNRQ